eukprot:Phypoly_transcript_00487.p1 GENE.Phypoly_transcript_00487~~Phypoly_transcript_00487.p1  ORF type:complete len:1495 (+),score=338.32 Phypoly_transcript_00487:159-4487(+)
MGIITDTNDAPLAIGDTVASLSLKFVPASYVDGNASFTFQVHDATSYSTNSAVATLVIEHVNNPPTSQDIELVASRGVPLPIVIPGFDHDADDTFTYNLIEIVDGKGTFALPDGTPVNTTSSVIATGVHNIPTHTFSATIMYTAPVVASGKSFSHLIVDIEDQGGLTTGNVLVSLDITPNSVPIATPESVTATQDSVSDPIFLNGTDADPADANTLTAVISAKPTKGVLLVTPTTNVSAVPYYLPAGTTVTYYTEDRGGDSFEFYVVDNMGATSGSVVVPIAITPVNHPPTAQFSGPAVGLENQNLVITQISTADPDGDSVFVWVTVLPDFGNLTQYDGTPISTTPTRVTQDQSMLIYVPPHGQFGVANFTFQADDGLGLPNSLSTPVVAVLGVTRVDGAPIAVNSTIVADEGSGTLNVTLTVVDSDTAAVNLSVYLTSLPDPAIGTLYDYFGNPVQPFVSTSVDMLLVLAQFGYGDTSFGFLGYDGELDSGDAAYVQISINHINQLPTVSAPTDVNLERSTPTSISIYAYDDDTPEWFDFVVISFSVPQGGTFAYQGTDLDGSSFPIVLEHNVAKSISGNHFRLGFTAPANKFGDGFANVTIAIWDSAGASSSNTSIVMNVLAGSKPVAIPAGPVTFLEEASSALITLGGTDPDPADNNALSVVITTLPTKSVLVQKGLNGQPDVSITSAPFALSNPVVYFRGNPLAFGADQFRFQVVDLINATSDVETVLATITHVNHPPIAGAAVAPGLMNQPLIFNVFGQDPDNDIPLLLYVTSVPLLGTLFQGDGATPIASANASAPVLVTDFNGKLVYVPPTNQYGNSLAAISVYVDDNSETSNSKSPDLAVNFDVTRVDLPPTVANVSTSMPQNSRLAIAINATDPQGYATYITIVSFPAHGTFYRSDNVTEITPNSPTTSMDGIVIYVPPPKDFDSITGEPYATFTYRATAPNSTLSSNTGYASISVVRTFGAPKFTGATSYSIADNTNLTMLLSATSEVGSYSIVLTSTLNNTQGVLYVRFCMGSEGCSVQYVTNSSLPYTMNDPTMENLLRYTPPADKYGEAFAVFNLYVADQYGQSDPVTITINIYHVNIPPVIHPHIYYTNEGVFNWTNAIVNIVEGEDVSILWRLTDRDTPQANLTSLLYALPYRGHLYSCVETGNGSCVAGQLITTPGYAVNASADSLFRVVYRPLPSSSGQNYATFSISGYDGIAKSDRISLKINVKHINLAPWVNVLHPDWNASSSSAVIITGVSMNDTDASFYQETFRLTLTDLSGNPPASGNLKLINANEGDCEEMASNFTVNCTATVSKLNYLLNQISAEIDVGGSYVLTIFVDDLGAGADVADRATNHLNATGYVQINVTQNIPGGDVSKPKGSSVMTAVVASAAGAGVAAAFGVWRYMKKRHPPTDAFFGHEGIDTAVTENPLYEENDNFLTFTNVLYEGK